MAARQKRKEGYCYRSSRAERFSGASKKVSVQVAVVLLKLNIYSNNSVCRDEYIGVMFWDSIEKIDPYFVAIFVIGATSILLALFCVPRF